MSKYISEKLNNLTPYTPGEQPQEKKYVKLNTNESPFPPSPLAVKMAADAAVGLNLYSDPEAKALAEEASKYFGVNPDEVIFTNGSDEALFFAVMAFCDENTSLVFADITYGCYPVFADACGVPKKIIPLTEDFRIEPSDYFDAGGTVFIANPNAPTGIALAVDDVRKILETNRGNIVLIDEAYVDFGAESVLPLIHEYDNLIVTQTFSKSRSLAGARLGMAFANPALIRDLNTIKFSFNPYNVNRMTMAAGIGALRDDEYAKANMREIEKTREWASAELGRLGFICTDSKANFIFTKYVGTAAGNFKATFVGKDTENIATREAAGCGSAHEAAGSVAVIGSAAAKISGREIYERLKDAGVLVRHFDKPRISDYIRITVGSRADMRTLIAALEKILIEEHP